MRLYENSGIDFLCRGFISMGKTPAFTDHVSPEPAAHFVKIDALALSRSLDESYKVGGYAAVEKTATGDLLLLTSPQYNCMLRHTLASLRRFAQLAPGFADAARSRGLKSPEILIWRLMQSHLFAFSQVNSLDRDSVEFQAKGIQILCNDVPAIPDHL